MQPVVERPAGREEWEGEDVAEFFFELERPEGAPVLVIEHKKYPHSPPI